MKNYVIYLPDYTKSRTLAQRVLETGQAFGWNLTLYEGVDGKNSTWEQVQPCCLDAKCRSMLELPGVRGCFLSHWQLWNLCVEINETIGIFEHDIEFIGSPPEQDFQHVLKLEGFLKKKSRPAGEWYEGARAYLLHPAGAKRLVEWVQINGALPADVNIGLDVVDIQLCDHLCIRPHALYGKTDKRENSFTWNLQGMT
jgi:hypothetical protein